MMLGSVYGDTTQLSLNTDELNVPEFTTQHNLAPKGYRILTKTSLIQTRNSVFYS